MSRLAKCQIDCDGLDLSIQAERVFDLLLLPIITYPYKSARNGWFRAAILGRVI